MKTRGETHPNHVLTDERVREMRQLHKEGRSIQYLVNRYGVVHSTIYGVLHRHSWKHVLTKGTTDE